MKLLVLDGNSILNRAFYGVRPLTTKDGRPTNAIYGFLTMLRKIEKDVSPEAVAIAFDLRAPTFRHKKYAEYKAKRKGMPEELAAQLQPLKDLLTVMGYRIVTAEGWEADDIIGTLAAACRDSGDECVIATGDRDTLQLISKTVSVRLLTTKSGRPEAIFYDEDKIMETYGVRPEQLIDIKAIQGDASDNIPGVPGIGEKGAGELIRAFGTLDGVYENIDDPSVKAGTRAKLEAGRESAYLSRWLGTVATDAPVPLSPAGYTRAPIDPSAVRAQMTALELFSILEKMDLSAGEGTGGKDGAGGRDGAGGHEALPCADNRVDIIFASAKQALAIVGVGIPDTPRNDPDDPRNDPGTPHNDPGTPHMDNPGGPRVIDFVYECDDGLNLTAAAICSKDKIMVLSVEDAAAVLRELPLSQATSPSGRGTESASLSEGGGGEAAGGSNIIIRTHDLKKLCHIAAKSNIYSLTSNIHCLSSSIYHLASSIYLDTMLAAYLCNPSGSDFSLPRISAQYTGAQEPLPPFLAGAEFAVGFTQTADKLETAIDDAGLRPLLRDIEIPLAAVLADMEITGVEVDREGLEAFGHTLSEKIGQLECKATQLAGHSFNLNSPKQLGEILFGELGLPGGKRTKTGYSTSAEVLENLRGQHPLVDVILEHRTLQKLNSTYCVGLGEAIDPADGRIHTSFNQTETRTGRISSTEPNLQNIPVRTELGRELRRFFRAKDGWLLVGADYSQIELRVLAHMAGDSRMIEAFKADEDIHRITASQVFGVSPELVSSEMRSRAKAVNFGIVYGISAFSLAKDIGVSQHEAKAYIEGYLHHYPQIDRFMRSMIAAAKAKGYAETMWGRRRYLPELTSSNFNLRSFGERVARNMPIQGTAADIIKIAMVRIHNRLRGENLRARMIMQVHDELIIEAPEDEADRAAEILKTEMEQAAELSVPLAVDVHTGKTWKETK